MYTNGTKWDGGVKGHYKTMRLEEIEEMKNVILYYFVNGYAFRCSSIL